MTTSRHFLLTLCFLIIVTSLQAADVAPLAKAVNSIGPDGKNYGAAIDAVKQLSQMEADQIPQILNAIDGSKPVAANWLRAAVESIADRNRTANRPIPAAMLTNYIADKTHPAKGRVVAFRLLQKQSEGHAAELIPSFANDNALELRLLAVDRLIKEAADQKESGSEGKAKETYMAAFDAARNFSQIDQIAEELKELGEDVDISTKLGFLQNWNVIAAFDFDHGAGFERAYPPEKEIDLKAIYESKNVEDIASPASWREVTLGKNERVVDFNEVFAPVKEVIGYAVAEFHSDKDQKVELRWMTPNATRAWVNGELVASNPVYHSGKSFDQYRAHASLKKGKNSILVKVVQNEQTQSWTNVWQVQLRVCDELGTAIHPSK